jgi:hypothetical protein
LVKHVEWILSSFDLADKTKEALKIVLRASMEGRGVKDRAGAT